MQNAVVRVGILLRIDQHAAYLSHRRLHTVVPAYQAWWSALLFVLERVWLPGTVSGSLSVPHSAMEEVDKGVAGIIIGEGEQGADIAAPDIAAQTQVALTRPGALTALSRARLPVLALTGSEDRQTTPEAGHAAADAAPIGGFQLLPGLGHYALIEDPAACANAVMALERTLCG